MGTIVEAKCECGYRSGTLAVGVGMSGPSPRSAVAICRRCPAVVTVNAEAARKRCPQCRGPVELPAVREDADSPLNEVKQLLECPRCGHSRLELVNIGDWD
jgi:Zn finger protein HypA/HybF involved in hydrogenase expression